jgi:hypothetical protein
LDIPLARKVDGKKFVWDGALYDSEAQAREVMAGYAQDGFEVEQFAAEDKFVVYSRRLATAPSAD